MFLNLSRINPQRTIKDLGLKFYRLMLLQALNEDDPNDRCEFSETLLNLDGQNLTLTDKVVWRYEAI